MRIHRMLAVAAWLAVATLGTSVARADSGGLDPNAKIKVPTDPDVIVPCSSVVNENTVCFTETNALDNPAIIAGPTLEEVEDNPLFEITTNFFYEPDNCATS